MKKTRKKKIKNEIKSKNKMTVKTYQVLADPSKLQGISN